MGRAEEGMEGKHKRGKAKEGRGLKHKRGKARDKISQAHHRLDGYSGPSLPPSPATPTCTSLTAPGTSSPPSLEACPTLR